MAPFRNSADDSATVESIVAKRTASRRSSMPSPRSGSGTWTSRSLPRPSGGRSGRRAERPGRDHAAAGGRARAHAARLARQPPHVLVQPVPRPRAHGLPRPPGDQRRPRRARRGVPAARAPGHGDPLVRAERRPRAPRQPRHGLRDPAGGDPAHERRDRRPPQRVQPVVDRRGPVPPDLDPPRADGAPAGAASMGSRQARGFEKWFRRISMSLGTVP